MEVGKEVVSPEVEGAEVAMEGVAAVGPAQSLGPRIRRHPSNRAPNQFGSSSCSGRCLYHIHHLPRNDRHSLLGRTSACLCSMG